MRRTSLASIAVTMLALGSSAAEPPAPPAPVDPLPAGAVVRFGTSRLQDYRYGDPAVFSPDGKLLLTAAANGPVSVWDTATGKLLRTHPPVGSVFSVRWMPDGKVAATAFVDSHSFMMHEWAGEKDLGPSPERILELFTTAREKARTESLLTAKFLDDHRVIAFYIASKPGCRAEVYKFVANTTSATAEPERSVNLPGNPLGISRDGKVVFANASAAKRLAAFDLTAAKDADKPAWEIAFAGDAYHFPVVCHSTDGKRVIVQFADDSVELWDGQAGKRLSELPRLPTQVLNGTGERAPLALSVDGKQLAMIVRAKNGEVGGRIIDLDTGKEVVALAAEPTPRLGGASFSPDGKRLLLSAHGVVRIWDAETGADARPFPGHRGRITSIVTAPDGKTVVTAGEDLTVRAWDPTTGKEKWKVNFPQGVRVAFALADTAVVEGPGIAEPLLDLATGKARALPGKMGEGRKPENGLGGRELIYDQLIAVAPDGKSAVTVENFVPIFGGGSSQASLRLWSWSAGELKKTVSLDVPKDLLATRVVARFTPDGKELLSVTHCRVRQPLASGPPYLPMLIDRWDVATGKRLDRKEMANVYPLWTRDGSQLLVVRNEGEIQDAFSGKAAGRAAHSNTDPFTVWTLGGMALSPDGKSLAVGGDFMSPGSVRLYEMKSGHMLAKLPAGGRGRLEVAFLPDGRLVSAGETAVVWAADAADKIQQPEKP